MAEPDPAEQEHLGEIAKAQLVAQTGHGGPADRDPEALEEELRDGFVTEAAALQYGDKKRPPNDRTCQPLELTGTPFAG